MPPTNMPKVERRSFSGLQLRELEKPAEGRIATLSGYAAVFNSLSEDLGGFREYIRVGAFKNSLGRGDDIRALMGHDTRLVIGRRSAKTLEIAEDEKGLKVEIGVPDTSVGRDLVVSVKRGDITGMSFGFSVVKQDWSRQSKDGDTVYRRELIDVDLYEVSPVAFPAYAETSVEARALMGEVLQDGIRRLGTDARPAEFGPEQRARRDRLISVHRARVRLWTGS